MLCAHVVPITRKPPSSSSSSSSRLSCCRTTQRMRIISSSSTETNGKEEDKEANSILSNRRSLVLNSSALPLFLGVLFDVGSKAPKPQLGVQEFNGIKSLTLCPPDSVNCLSTAEEMGQAQAYAPPWTFNPPESIRVLKQTGVYDVATAKDQLVDIIKTTDCDGFTAEITEEYDDYVRATYTSPTFGFVDDVEFWFTRDDRSTVEYSSRSRTGKDDGGKNRNRIRTLRKALTAKYDWASVGF